jgi:hypothetical protein
MLAGNWNVGLELNAGWELEFWLGTGMLADELNVV